MIDEVHLPAAALAGLQGPVADVIRVERSRTPEDLRFSLRRLLETLGRTELTKLAPDVETWLRRVVGPKRFRGLDLKSWKEIREVTTMLEERARQWEQEFLDQGQDAGLRSAFRKLFQLKFQRDLVEEEETRLVAANRDELERLIGRILTAARPAELFSADSV